MRSRWALAAFTVTVVLLGCGGGTPSGPPPTDAGPGGIPSSAPTSPPGTPIDGPTSAPVPTEGGLAELPDPCSLITLDEAAAAILAPVSAGLQELVSEPLLGEGRTCRFRNAGGGDGEATTYTWPNPDELYDVFKLQQSQFGPVEELAGVGDKAFSVGNGECNVVKDEVLLQVLMVPADGFATDPEPRTVVLCQQAAARL